MAVTTSAGFVFSVVCQAFVLGTFDRLDLLRTAKGKVTLTQQWRVAFYPLPSKTLKWRECEDTVNTALAARCRLWDGILAAIDSPPAA